jgi:hypothetical protein
MVEQRNKALHSELVLAIEFGRGGSEANHLGAGWSPPEDGFRWMVGEESELWLDNPGPGTAFVLQAELAPYCAGERIPSQRLVVAVRGTVVGRSVLTTLTNVAYRVPADLVVRKGPVRIVFQHPDAACPIDNGHPSDSRQLAFAVHNLKLLRVAGDLSPFRLEGGAGITASELETQTGTPAAQFMLRFESLGDNCEFGLVQRRCGAEPLGLLRFSNLQLPNLIHGLETDFRGLGEPDALEFWLDKPAGGEYVMRDKRYSLVFHTFLGRDQVEELHLPLQQATRLQFLRRKLLEDLLTGEKIFVLKRNQPIEEQEILPLCTTLNRFGRNTLFWVVPADLEHEPGTVEQIIPGLLKGYIDRFAPYENAHDLSFDLWLKLCVNAWQLASPATEAGKTEAQIESYGQHENKR